METENSLRKNTTGPLLAINQHKQLYIFHSMQYDSVVYTNKCTHFIRITIMF